MHSVLKGFVSVFTEMYLDGVSGVPQLSLETVGLLLVFWFLSYSLLLYIKIERIDWFLYTLTLCYIPYSVVIVVMVVSTNWNLND